MLDLIKVRSIWINVLLIAISLIISLFVIFYSSEMEAGFPSLEVVTRQRVLVVQVMQNLRPGKLIENDQAARDALARSVAGMRANQSLAVTSDFLPSDAEAIWRASWAPQTGAMWRLCSGVDRILSGEAVSTREDAAAVLEMLHTLDVMLRHRETVITRDIFWGAIFGFVLVAAMAGAGFMLVLTPMANLLRNQMEKSRLMSAAVEQSGSMVVITDTQGIITYVNPQAEIETGYSAEELRGTHSKILASGLVGPDIFDNLWETLVRGISWRGKYCNRHKDGDLVWLDVVVSPIRDAGGQVTHYLSIGHNITESHHIQNRLLELQTQLVTAVESIEGGFALFDADERLLLCNVRYARMHGNCDPVMPIGKTFLELLQSCVDKGVYDLGGHDRDGFIAHRLRAFRAANEDMEQRMADGRWIRISDRSTADGGRVVVRIDDTPLKKAQEHMQAARDEADAANRAKSAFLSSMSHELRTPLNAIMGFAQMLQMMGDEPLSLRQQRCVEYILKGSQHLLDLINQVLDLAKIESGMVTVSLEPVDIGHAVAEAVDVITPMASKRGLRIEAEAFRRDGVWGCVMADSMRLRQVLLNLLSNAVKYNREDGTIRVDATIDATSLRLSVSDTGRGIPSDRMAEIFRPFNRLGAEHSEIEGTGIGLAITHQLVEMMGGTIGCSSAQDVGTTFDVTLPRAEPVWHDWNAGGGSCAMAVPAPSWRGNILYIEDNPSNIKLMEMMMSRLPGIELRTAHTAELGLAMACDRPPHLIFMDLNLPGLDGVSALHRLRGIDRLRHVPVVALTASLPHSSREQAAMSGFWRVLAKPVQIPVLFGLIKDLMDDAPENGAS